VTTLQTSSACENPGKGENPSSMVGDERYSPFSRFSGARAALDAARVYRRPRPTPSRGGGNRPVRAAVACPPQPTPSRAVVPCLWEPP